jgi:hypothetical protein
MRKLVRYQFLNLCLRHHTTPTQFQVNSSPNCLDHAGGMIDLKLLKRRGLLQNSLSYIALVVIVAGYDKTQIITTKPASFRRFGAGTLSFS